MLNYQNILNLLMKFDPIGINFGNNIDEYKPEAESILNQIKETSTREEILLIVHQEFIRWFGVEIAGGKSKYIDIADEIYNLKDDI